MKSKRTKVLMGVLSLIALAGIIIGSSPFWTMSKGMEIFLYLVFVPGFVLWYVTPAMLAEEYAAENTTKINTKFNDPKDVR